MRVLTQDAVMCDGRQRHFYFPDTTMMGDISLGQT